MIEGAAPAVVAALGLALARAVGGPTVFDRALAANSIGTLALLMLAVLGFLTGRPEFLDLAILYGMLNIIGTVAVLKFFRYGDLGDPGGGGAVSALLEYLSWGLILAGSGFCVAGALGLVRLKGFYPRTHAASVIDSAGGGLLLPRPL